MNPTMLTEAVWLGFIALLFGLSAATKLRYWREFVQAMRTWRIVPRRLHSATGAAITVIEMAMAAVAFGSLWLGALRSLALLTVTGVFAMFLVAQVLIIARTRSAECGCGGSGRRVNTQLLGRTGALLSVSSLVWFASIATGA